MSPLGLMPSNVRAKLAAAADKRIANYQPELTINVWEGPEVHPTLPGHVHGIIDHDPWEVQCDGCGLIETVVTLAISTIRFHRDQGKDSRRLCVSCRERAGWQGEAA